MTLRSLRHGLGRRRRLAGVALVVLVAGPGSAQGGGYAFPDLGAASLARGGAFVARADDPTAIFYNPAGAARLRGTQILIDGHLVSQSIFFQRRQYSDPSTAPEHYPGPLSDQRMPAVENQAGPAVAPFVGVTSDLRFLRRFNLVLMAGIYGPSAHPRRTFPRFCVPGTDPCVPADASGVASPSRYELERVEILAIHPTIGLAWQPLDGLSFGAALLLSYIDFSWQAATGLNGEDPESDLDVRVDADSPVTPTGLFGVHYRPFPSLELGASVRLGFTYRTSGELCVGDRRADGHCELPRRIITGLLGGVEAAAEPNPARISLDLPERWIVRGGLRYIAHDVQGRERFDLELDFVWERSSSLQTFTAELGEPLQIVFVRDGNVFKEIVEISLLHAWDDSYSLRLGGSYRLHDVVHDGELIFSAGGLFESGAMRTEHTRLDFLPMTRIGIAAGVALRWGRYQLSLAYARLFHPARDVDPAPGQPACAGAVTEECGSLVKQIAPLRPGQLGAPIGNGRYELSIDQLTLGARVSFDP